MLTKACPENHKLVLPSSPENFPNLIRRAAANEGCDGFRKEALRLQQSRQGSAPTCRSFVGETAFVLKFVPFRRPLPVEVGA